MNSTLDKLTPGWPAKVNLAFDLVILFIASGLALQAPPVDDPTTLSMAFLGLISWVFGAAVLRLYSPTTARSNTDHLTLTLLLVVTVSMVLFLWERLILSDAHRFSVTSFGLVVLVWTMAGRVLVFNRCAPSPALSRTSSSAAWAPRRSPPRRSCSATRAAGASR